MIHFEVERAVWKLVLCVVATMSLALWSVMRWVGVPILARVEVRPEV
jgi:hypothetical protein